MVFFFNRHKTNREMEFFSFWNRNNGGITKFNELYNNNNNKVSMRDNRMPRMNVSFIRTTIATDRELSPKDITLESAWNSCSLLYRISSLFANGFDRLCALKELIAVNQHFLEEEEEGGGSDDVKKKTTKKRNSSRVGFYRKEKKDEERNSKKKKK